MRFGKSVFLTDFLTEMWMTFCRSIVFTFCLFAMLSCIGCASDDNDVIKNVSSLEELDGESLSVLIGSVQDLYLSEKCPNCNYLRLGSVPELLASVEKGVSDYMSIDSVLLIGGHLKERNLKSCFVLDLSFDVGVAFNKDNERLCAQFNTFLSEIKKDGTIDQMKRRWAVDSICDDSIPRIDTKKEGIPLKIAVMSSYPFEFIRNGEWDGFEVEMLRRFANYIGRPVVFQTYDFSGMIPALISNKVDAICSFLYITEERQKQVLFSDSYYSSNSVVISRISNLKKKNELGFIQRVKSRFENNIIAEDRWKLIVDGLYETIIISFFSIFIGVLIGIVLCFMRMSRGFLLSAIARIFVGIIRGVPILVFMMIMFYIIFSDSGLPARWIAIIAFSFYFGAYVSEMFRSGIESVDRGQFEAGLAMGFSKVSNFMNFVLPIAVKNISSVFKGEAVSLIKNTSIVGFIGIQDLTKVSDMIRSRTFDAFFPLIVISIIYFVLAWLLGVIIDKIASKL